MTYRSNPRNSFEEAMIRSVASYYGVSYEEAVDKHYESSRVRYVKEYVPDITLDNGVMIELKGYFPPEDRAKMIQVKQCNPELDIRIIFMSNSKLNSKSRLRYLDWADKHGFKAHVIKGKNMSIPKEWYD